jgi:hypothetical protein
MKKAKLLFFILVFSLVAGCVSEKPTEVIQAESSPTEMPPSVTPEPLPTNTPQPTDTPEPTATIDADPAVYDNFSNPANDDFFNQGQWRLSGNASPPVVQQKDGVIMFSDEGEQEYTATVLVAKNFDGFQIESPMYFEVDLMLSPESGPGGISLTLYGLDISPDWSAKCFIQYYDKHGANCMHASWDEGLSGEYDSFYRTITPGDWHNFRIEIDPETMEFTYYIDGVISGRGIPLDVERLRGAEFQVVIGISKSTVDQPVVGFADNIRIGPIMP